MARQSAVTLVALAAVLCISTANARFLLQSDVTATRVGTAGATSLSHKYGVPANGCLAFEYKPNLPAFNYTSFLGLQDPLPAGCSETDLKISKAYTRGACANTRENNYPVKALGITNDPKCFNVIAPDNNTCHNVIGNAPKKDLLVGLKASDEIDSETICWKTPSLYYFMQNNCNQVFTVTIKVTFNAYDGVCAPNDGDDSAYTEAEADGSSGGSGLSKGAKAGIAIGVIVGVVVLAAIVWAVFFQLRSA